MSRGTKQETEKMTQQKVIRRDTFEAMALSHPIEAKVWEIMIARGEARIVD